MIAIIQAVRRSKEDKERTHDAIVEVASEQIRERGIDGPGVADLMRAAGLTHGGFYKHFESRDDLVAEALRRALHRTDARVAAIGDGADDPFAAIVDAYLATSHRDDVATGCALAALGADVARGGEDLQAAYRGQVERYVARLADALGGADDPEARARALLTVSALVGALVLARASGAGDLSDEILGTVRAQLERER
jgi:TetR/AcrR family transcriptional regulator, transcriptional repressor for nem operon